MSSDSFCDPQIELALNANLLCSSHSIQLTEKPMTCNSPVTDKWLMLSLAQANIQISKPQLYSISHPEETVDPLSVVRVLKCNKNLRKEPNVNVLCKCYWNRKRKTCMRVSGNKMSCFHIQNLVSQRKHLNSTKHMKNTNKQRKRKSTYHHMLREIQVLLWCVAWVFLDVLCFFTLTLFHIIQMLTEPIPARVNLSMTIHGNQVSLGIRIDCPLRGVCKLTRHFESSTWREYWAAKGKCTRAHQWWKIHESNTKLVHVSSAHKLRK